MEGENGFDDARMVDITEKYMAALEKDLLPEHDV